MRTPLISPPKIKQMAKPTGITASNFPQKTFSLRIKPRYRIVQIMRIMGDIKFSVESKKYFWSSWKHLSYHGDIHYALQEIKMHIECDNYKRVVIFDTVNS